MNDRKMQFLVGVVVLFTVLIALLLVMVNSPLPESWVPWGKRQFQVAIRFREAPGVAKGTPVRKNGLLIGRVKSIEDAEAVGDAEHGVVVWANIDEGRTLYAQYVPELRTSVLNDATIDFQAQPVPPGAAPVAAGHIYEGEVAKSAFEAIAKLGDLQGDIEQTMRALTRAGDEVADLAEQLQGTFGDETEEGRMSQVLDKTETALSEFSQTMRSFNDILGGDTAEDIEMRRKLKQGLAKLPDAIDSAERNLKNLEGFTEPLGRNGEQIATGIIDAVDGLDRLVEEFTLLTQALNSREGTLGQLIHNPELYNNLNQLVVNANYVVVRVNDLVARLRPVLEDARVFMDKIAREPGRIVGGALNRGPGIK